MTDTLTHTEQQYFDEVTWALKHSRFLYERKAAIVVETFLYLAAALYPKRAEEFIGNTPLWAELQTVIPTQEY